MKHCFALDWLPGSGIFVAGCQEATNLSLTRDRHGTSFRAPVIARACGIALTLAQPCRPLSSKPLDRRRT
jgi:hypothetical protein